MINIAALQLHNQLHVKQIVNYGVKIANAIYKTFAFPLNTNKKDTR